MLTSRPLRLGASVILSASLLTACSHTPEKPPEMSAAEQKQAVAEIAQPATEFAPLMTAYSYQILDSKTRQPITLDQMAAQLKNTDVVFVGEYHGNQASHLLQAQLQAKLFEQHPNQILTMEQFERDQQDILNQYLDSEIGEKTLMKEAPAWKNYAGSYRPLIEFAKQRMLPVVAGNAPGQTVRCVGRQGQDYLNKLDETDRANVAKDAFYFTPEYQEKFQGFMSKNRPKAAQAKTDKQKQRAKNSFSAQLLRDNTMAESIYNAHLDNPKAQIIQTNGAFHSDAHLGTAASLKHLAPTLRIQVIAPVHVKDPMKPTVDAKDFAEGDFIYLVPAQPKDYVQKAKRRAAMKAMFDKARKKAEKCL